MSTSLGWWAIHTHFIYQDYHTSSTASCFSYKERETWKRVLPTFNLLTKIAWGIEALHLCMSLAALKCVIESQSCDWIPVSYVTTPSTTRIGVTRRLSWDHCTIQGLGFGFTLHSLQRNDTLGTEEKRQHWLRNVSEVGQLQVGHLGLE